AKMLCPPTDRNGTISDACPLLTPTEPSDWPVVLSVKTTVPVMLLDPLEMVAVSVMVCPKADGFRLLASVMLVVFGAWGGVVGVPVMSAESSDVLPVLRF